MRQPAAPCFLLTCALPMTSSHSQGYLGVAKFPWSFSEGDARDSVFVAARTLPNYQPTEESCEWGCRYNQGNTLVHEIGHYLGLYHTFRGDSCNGSGDEVADTPTQSTPSTGCKLKKSKNKDSCSEDDEPDAWWNFMDYTDDSCMQCFSPGQAARVHASLTLFRPTLLDASTVGPTPTTTTITITTTTTTTTITTTTTTIASSVNVFPTVTPAEQATLPPTTPPPSATTSALDPCGGKSRAKYCYGRGNPKSDPGDAAACKCSDCSGGFAGNRCNECAIQVCGPGKRRVGTCSVHTGSVYSCKPCPDGTYKTDTSASTVCTRHAANVHGGSSSSSSNGGGSSGGEGAGQVVCGPGHKATYTATSATPICAACSLGQYSDTEDGATSCTAQSPALCRAGEELLNLHSTTAKQQCVQCPAGSYKPDANGNRCMPQTPLTCEAGFRMTNEGSRVMQHGCTRCAAGTYKESIDGATSCTAHAAVECAAGYEPTDLVSTTTPRGCKPCGAGMYSSSPSVAAPTCVAATAEATAKYAVFCLQLDTYFAGQKESLCNAFASQVCPEECGACVSETMLASTISIIKAAGLSTNVNANANNKTQANNIIVAGNTQNIATAAYYDSDGGGSDGDGSAGLGRDAMAAVSRIVLTPSNGRCVPHNLLQLCGRGQYLSASKVSATDTYSCELCAAGTYSAATSTEQQCTAHQPRLCGKGRYLESSVLNATQTCAACPHGQYSNTTDTARTCTAQPPAVCSPGSYLANENSAVSQHVCSACPDGHYTSGANRAAQCTPQAQQPQSCGEGFYLANLGSTAAPQQCKSCPSGTHKQGTNAATRCTEGTDTVCGPGFYSLQSSGNDDGGNATMTAAAKCRACRQGTYKAGTNNATACTAHPTVVCATDQAIVFAGSTTRPHACSQCWKTTATEAQKAALPRKCMNAWRGARRLR